MLTVASENVDLSKICLSFLIVFMLWKICVAVRNWQSFRETGEPSENVDVSDFQIHIQCEEYGNLWQSLSRGNTW